MSLKQVKKANITEQVFTQLKQQIISGEWKQGDRLPSENELGEILGVSRVTVRQALQKLTVLGLVETRSGDGSYITSNLGALMNTMVPVAYLNDNDVLQVLEFRKVIETESAGLAATKATKEDIAELEKILAQMEHYKDNRSRFAAYDLDFHFKIAEMTRNNLIISTHTILRDILSVSMQDIVELLGYEVGIHYHKKLIEAISAADYQSAKQVMADHLDQTSIKIQEKRV